MERTIRGAALAMLVVAGGCMQVKKTETETRVDAAPVSRQEWCSRAEQFKENADWECTWPPGRYGAGDYGAGNKLGRYNIVGTVFDDDDPKIGKKLIVRKIGTVEIDVQKSLFVRAGVGVQLTTISPWLPDAAITVQHDSALTMSFALEDAEWRLYQNLEPALIDAFADAGSITDAKKKGRLDRARTAMCDGDTELVVGVLVGKLAVNIKQSSGSTENATLGWDHAGATIRGEHKDGGSITVKNEGEQVALLYQVNKAHSLLDAGNVCAEAAKKP